MGADDYEPTPIGVPVLPDAACELRCPACRRVVDVFLIIPIAGTPKKPRIPKMSSTTCPHCGQGLDVLLKPPVARPPTARPKDPATTGLIPKTVDAGAVTKKMKPATRITRLTNRRKSTPKIKRGTDRFY